MKSSTLFHLIDPHPLLPPCVQLTSFRWMLVFPVLPRFSRSSTSVYYTERKPKNKKRGRPGNEDMLCPHVLKIFLHVVHACYVFMLCPPVVPSCALMLCPNVVFSCCALMLRHPHVVQVVPSCCVSYTVANFECCEI